MTFCLCVCLCIMGARCSQRSEDCVDPLGPELPCGCWELNPGPLHANKCLPTAPSLLLRLSLDELVRNGSRRTYAGSSCVL